MKLKHWLYTTLLMVSLIPLLVCGCILLYRHNRNIEAVVENSLLETSDSQADNIEKFFEDVKQDMEMLSSYSFLQEEVLASLGRGESAGDTAKRHIGELLKEQKNCRSYIESVNIVNAEFKLVATSENYLAGEESGLDEVAPVYRTGEFRVGNIYIRETSSTRKPLVFACKGIYDAEQLIGYIVVEIPTEFFNQYHEGNAFWNNGVMKVLDGNGKIVTVGGDGEAEAGFESSQEVHDKQVERAWNNRSGENSGSVIYEVENNRYISTYSKLEYSDWKIRVTFHVDEYKSVGQSGYVVFIVVTAISAVLFGLMYFFVAKRMLHPMEKIREILKEIQETQDYSIRIEVRSDDELGALQHEINHLLQHVWMTQMQDKEEQMYLEKKAEKDPMTGIMNKKAIAQCVQERINEVEQRSGKLTVGFVDIDNFRDYNTKYGHAEGDNVIKFVAHALREMIPGVVGRNGGDEFVFCMEADEREIVEQVLSRLMRRLSEGVINTVTNVRMPIPCSIGIVIDRAENTDCRKMIQEADEAMYQAKGNGKNTYHIIVK